MVRVLFGTSAGWIGISMVVDGVPALLVPYQLLLNGHGDATTLGATSFVAISLGAMLQLWAGGWSDRVGRFPVIWVGTLVALAGLGLMVSPSWVVAGFIISLAGVGVAQAGHQALFADRVDWSWRGRAGGTKSAFDVGGALLGFVVLGSLLGAGQPGLAVGVLGVLLVGGFALGFVLLHRDPACRSKESSHGRQSGGFGPGDRRDFLVLVLARFLFLLGIFTVGRFLLLFVAARFGLSAGAAADRAAFVLALLAIVTVLVSLPAGWASDRVGRRRIALWGGALGAVGIGLLGGARSISTIVVLGTLMAVGSAAFSASSWAMLGDMAASSQAGRLLAYANLGTAGAAATAGGFGFLIDAVGSDTGTRGFAITFAAAAAVTLAGGCLAWLVEDQPSRTTHVQTEEASY